MSEQGVPPIIQKPAVVPKAGGQPPPAAAAAMAAAKGRKPGKEGRTLEILFRTAVGLLLVFSLAVAYWSYFYVLGSRQRQVRDLTSRVAQLSSEVDQLDRAWSPENAAAVSNRLAKVPAVLFSSPEEVQQWWRKLKKLEEPLAIEIKVEPGKTRPVSQSEKVSVIPTALLMELRPSPGIQDIEPSFQRVLRFSQALVYNEQRADITQLNVTGDSNSVAQVRMMLDLWASEEGAAP